MYLYLDCFYYSFIINEDILEKYKITFNQIKTNNYKIKYLENKNYIKAKKINKNIRSFRSISKDLNNLVI